MKKIIALLWIIFLTCLAHAEPYVVERVVDGESLKLTNGKTVRLIGVDATSPFPMKDSGLEVWRETTEFLSRLLKPQLEVRLEFDAQKENEDGQLLAYVFVHVSDKPCKFLEVDAPAEYYFTENEANTCYLFINAVIIKAGYSLAATFSPNGKYTELFQEFNEQAKGKKKGFWMNEVTCKGHGEMPVWNQGDNLPAEIGEYFNLMNAQCCPGTVPKTQKKHFESNCAQLGVAGYSQICIACGDEFCDAENEDKCNCPQDCARGDRFELHSEESMDDKTLFREFKVKPKEVAIPMH